MGKRILAKSNIRCYTCTPEPTLDRAKLMFRLAMKLHVAEAYDSHLLSKEAWACYFPFK